MGFGKKQWYLYAAAVPLTLLVMLSTLQMVRGLLLPAAFLTVLFYNVCQIAHVKTLDFGKLTGLSTSRASSRSASTRSST